MQYVKHELARGLGDWEQRLNTALVPTSPTVGSSVAEHGDDRDADDVGARPQSRTCATTRVLFCRASRWRVARVRRDGLAAPLNATACVASSAASAGRTRARRKLLGDARIPPRYARCDLDNFVLYPNEKLIADASRTRAASPTRFPPCRRACASSARRASARRTSPSPCCAASIVEKRRARSVLRRPRSAARDSLDLQPGRPHRRDGHPAAGDGGRAARARRSRRGKAVRMGRRDDEPHRQHALQRAAADDLHDQLRGPARRDRARLAEGARRLPPALAPARDVRVPRVRRRRLPDAARQRRPRRPGHALEEEPRPPRRCPARTQGQAARAKSGEPQELKWPGGKAGRRTRSDDRECSASTSTSRSARRSAATATSTAVCSTAI